MIVVTTGCRMTLTTPRGTTQEDIGTPLLDWTSHPWHVSQEGALGACSHFLDCLQRGVPADTSGEDNLKTYALVDAAYLVDDAGCIEQPLGQARLTGVYMRQNPQIQRSHEASCPLDGRDLLSCST